MGTLIFPINKTPLKNMTSITVVFYLILPDIISILYSASSVEGKRGMRRRGREGKQEGERNSFGIHDVKLALRYRSQNMAFFGFEPVQYYYWPQWMEFQSLLENTVIDVPCVI